MEELPGFLSTRQAGERVGMHYSQIRKLLRDGKLKGIKVGHDWVVEVASLEHYIAHSGRPGGRGPRPKG
jgi:excisionase family DNA binding protein